MIYRIVANVRRLGAIGIFYDEVFSLTSDVPLNLEGMKDAWFAEFGQSRELNHFVATEELREEQP